MFLGKGTRVVCLKQVGFTDWVRERMKMAHALIILPGILSDPVTVNLFKGLNRSSGHNTGQVAAGLPIVISDSLQSLATCFACLMIFI